ncbi:glycine/D-amino acid oxidase-like deaminating enzyme [Kribbella sp. VKM Ac-2527]|uniref:Glycine/D-amino acid oxidase-like deaminating enzyme n=1 Tax=Kribbella caucasensis TaxID=2512215 RepID=A0A4R6KV67_9ACTN|nr:FAD-binding oxidoreductase [Kribbella sp. VKM Ac-2527]TDO55017.1 glycine/D-amino acid oxidase-like deaminating enzyme [Kribbella sp. VKM Ac-2527]
MSDWPNAALADAEPLVFWLDDKAAPEPEQPLAGPQSADLAVVGGGYTGLWTALRAKDRHPDLDAIDATIARLDIDCGWERTGELTVATAPHHLAELAEEVEQRQAYGHEVALLDAAAARAELNSPTYLGALFNPRGTALVEPARLAWGLRQACLVAGVRIHEHTRVTAVRRDGAARSLLAATGSVRAERIALATNAFPSLLKRLRLYTVPVYDLVLVTEPLSPGQLDTIGWRHRQGVGDASNLFHYYRLTRDNRILWGGYTPLYYFGSRIYPELEQRDAIHRLLARHFFETFPQLDGLRFTHRWGGVIDTSTRFCAFFGTASEGRIGYVLGYTGLGVAATRFGAEVMLDLLYGEETERTRLRMVRERPIPFPPEPLRYAGIQLTRWSMARADANSGHRNLWLRALDRLGLGFDF